MSNVFVHELALQQTMKCTICYEPRCRVPKGIACGKSFQSRCARNRLIRNALYHTGHVFCGECLDQYVARGAAQGGLVICPTCRGPFSPELDSFRLYVEYDDEDPSVKLTEERDRFEEDARVLRIQNNAQMARIEELLARCDHYRAAYERALAEGKTLAERLKEKDTSVQLMHETYQASAEQTSRKMVAMTASLFEAQKERDEALGRLQMNRMEDIEAEASSLCNTVQFVLIVRSLEYCWCSFATSNL